MTNYKITIEYDGTKYSGWQKQGNTDNTIQGKLEKILFKLFDEEIEIHGSGRTDGGVHAKAQVANFKIKENMSCETLQEHLNNYLPKDIRVKNIEIADIRFHSRLNAKEKHYRYIVDNNEIYDVFSRNYCFISNKYYDIEKMQAAASLLIGEHDFKSFCDNKRMKKSTTRIINEITVKKENGKIVMDFYGNGFLYHMVRILTGTLLEVGEGKINPDKITDILESLDRKKAGFLAPACGLYLIDVKY